MRWTLMKGSEMHTLINSLRLSFVMLVVYVSKTYGKWHAFEINTSMPEQPIHLSAIHNE